MEINNSGNSSIRLVPNLLVIVTVECTSIPTSTPFIPYLYNTLLTMTMGHRDGSHVKSGFNSSRSATMNESIRVLV